MALENETPRSRRALLAAGLAAGAAAIATAATRPLPAHAADGDAVLVGHTYTGATVTKIDVGSSGAYALMGMSATGGGVYGGSTSGTGVVGNSTSNIGVSGTSNTGTGVSGSNVSASQAAVVGQTYGDGTGVQGFSGNSSIVAAPAKTGVYGYAAQDGTAVGVMGESTTGIGGLFAATTGTALKVAGRAQFSRSGKASVLAGKTFVDVTVAGGLVTNSVVHATLQTYRSGVAIAAARKNYPTTGKVRIYLTKVASTTASTSVAWLVTEY